MTFVAASFVAAPDATYDMADAHALLEAVPDALGRPALRYVITERGARVVAEPDKLLLGAMRAPPWMPIAMADHDPEGEREFGPIFSDGDADAIDLVTLDADRPVGQLHVTITIPETTELVARLPRLVKAVAPLVKAAHGVASPTASAIAINDRVREQYRAAREAGDFAMDIRGDQPAIGWACYWSAATCDRLRFSPAEHRDLFAVVEELGPGVYLQLTAEPLDLNRPEHLAALQAVYEAFPAL